MLQPTDTKKEEAIQEQTGAASPTGCTVHAGLGQLRQGAFTNLLHFKRHCLGLFFFFLILVHLFIKVKQVRGDLWVCHPGSRRPTTAFNGLGNL